MDFIKKNEETTVISNYEAVDGDNIYEAMTSKVNGTLRSVNVNVKKTAENGTQHLGQMSLQNGHKSASFTVGESIASHVATFEEFLTFIERGTIVEPPVE